ncbi:MULTISPECIES: Hsp33 family molecular chaperone HslO [unclassified Methylophilus]|uniref:Hsp33 family molecular chaperone HslO n=1 Tax=unclassified Methylophilus TaxID=2630143 RepID=UPI00188E1C67|nr:Hsp33 family molecular chaperone HslO [Methylophilus sp. 13]MBF5038586.1 Hsp33 family molecular chaperone HslO [Methylophilus sp. 13]BEV07483.1 Hsp33 family molecular chaperone HslO [Methylophilus sp. DW102]
MNNAQRPDQLHPFIFEQSAVRGNFVQLNQSLFTALEHQSLPDALKSVIGEFAAASVLLTSTLKMQGKLILQLQSKGALQLLVVECTSALNIRATAKVSGELNGPHLTDWLAQGQLVITLMPETGEPYQGIVPLEGDSIASMLENYMLRSQQIDTRLWLTAEGNRAAGLLLQKLPQQQESDLDCWNRVQHLAGTVTAPELLDLEAVTLLQRLFVEEDVRLFSGREVQAFCSCSQANVSNMLQMLGLEEVQSILQEQGSIEIQCDFCHKHYVVDEEEALALFEADNSPGIKH